MFANFVRNAHFSQPRKESPQTQLVCEKEESARKAARKLVGTKLQLKQKISKKELMQSSNL